MFNDRNKRKRCDWDDTPPPQRRRWKGANLNHGDCSGGIGSGLFSGVARMLAVVDNHEGDCRGGWQSPVRDDTFGHGGTFMFRDEDTFYDYGGPQLRHLEGSSLIIVILLQLAAMAFVLGLI